MVLTSADQRYRLSLPIIRFATSSVSISTLIESSGFHDEAYPWASRMLGRFPIPVWQRDPCWSDEDDQKFIHSVFQGFDLGSVMINGWEEDSRRKGVMRPMSDILLDGQQRTNALLRFVKNEISYESYFWDDLNRNEQRTFKETQIGRKMTNCFDEDILKRVYDLLNYSGVKHNESERAIKA